MRLLLSTALACLISFNVASQTVYTEGQAASATPLVSASMVTTDSGGLLQSPVPTHGVVNYTTTTTLSTATTTIETAAFLLVASGIKI